MQFLRITRPKEGVLRAACPPKPVQNSQIPVQNGGMAGLQLRLWANVPPVVNYGDHHHIFL